MHPEYNEDLLIPSDDVMVDAIPLEEVGEWDADDYAFDNDDILRAAGIHPHTAVDRFIEINNESLGFIYERDDV